MPTQFGKHFWPDFSIVRGLRIDYLSPTLYITDILILILFLLTCKNIFAGLRNHKKNILIFCFFILSIFLGVMNSQNQLAGVYGIIKFLEFVFLGTFIYFNRKIIDKNVIVIFLSIGIIFESMLAVFQYLNQGALQGLFYFLGERSFNSNTPGVANASINGELILRSYGTFSHPNVLGGYLVASLAICTLFIKKINKLFVLTLIFALIGIFFSFSRTSVLALVIFIICVFLISIYEKYKKGKLNQIITNKNLTIFIIALFIIIMFSLSQFSQRVFSIDLQDESISMRSKLIEQSIKMININPVFGVGVNNFFNNLDKEFNSPSEIQPVHNIFLLIFAETGIIGFMFLIALFIIAVKNIQGFITVLVILVLGTFDHYLFTQQQGQLLFTIIVSLLIAGKLSAKIN